MGELVQEPMPPPEEARDGGEDAEQPASANEERKPIFHRSCLLLGGLIHLICS